MISKIKVRPEKASDYPEIIRVNDLAFKRPNEGNLILALRLLEQFDPRLSLVAVKDNSVVGHILFFPTHIQVKDQSYPTLSLGPIAVLPDHQNQGIGGLLIDKGHQAALELGYASVILLGHPTYYPRFGYRMAALWGLSNPWGVHNEPFMAIELVKDSLVDKAGMVMYPAAFDQAA